MLKSERSEQSGTAKVNSGFTLIELVIVLVIIAILIIIMLTFFRGQLFKANDSKRKSDLNRITVAAEEYEKDTNCYPKNITCGMDSSQEVYPYLNDVPCDPTTKSSYYYEVNDPSSSCPKWFRISAKLQNTSDPQAQMYCGTGGIYNFYEGSSNAPSCQFTEKSKPRYGCKGSVCTPLLWDNSISNWECQPNYGASNCGNACGPASRCDAPPK